MRAAVPIVTVKNSVSLNNHLCCTLAIYLNYMVIIINDLAVLKLIFNNGSSCCEGLKNDICQMAGAFDIQFDRIQEIGEQFKLGDLVIDLSRRSASVRGAEVELTPTEFRLLTFFIESPNRTVSRQQIIDNVFGYDFSGYDRTVDTHVSNLRKKLDAASPDRKHLKTMYGFGYRFDA